jgi:DNA/RNA endonuclease G (NUC1)
MPNDEQKILVDWKKYRSTTAAIERTTGYKFFTTLKPDLADKLRQKPDAP